MKCPKCESDNVATLAERTPDKILRYTAALCCDCGSHFKPFNVKSAMSDIKIIAEAISEPARIPVTVYQRISTGEILATPTELFDRGLIHV